MSLAKQRLNHLGGVPDPADLEASQAEFYRLLQRPEAQALVADLFSRGLQTRGELELNRGDRLGPQPNGNDAATPRAKRGPEPSATRLQRLIFIEGVGR